MAEVQTSSQTGEMSQRFVEFVLMEAQQASLFLGRIPNPSTDKTEVHLEAAKMFIDQLEMIREKTRGNLSTQESEILNTVISDLQMGYVQASTGKQDPENKSAQAAGPESQAAPSKPEERGESPGEESESRKRFSKSYGS